MLHTSKQTLHSRMNMTHTERCYRSDYTFINGHDTQKTQHATLQHAQRAHPWRSCCCSDDDWGHIIICICVVFAKQCCRRLAGRPCVCARERVSTAGRAHVCVYKCLLAASIKFGPFAVNELCRERRCAKLLN
jgi:hypothetical protein